MAESAPQQIVIPAWAAGVLLAAILGGFAGGVGWAWQLSITTNETRAEVRSLRELFQAEQANLKGRVDGQDRQIEKVWDTLRRTTAAVGSGS